MAYKKLVQAGLVVAALLVATSASALHSSSHYTLFGEADYSTPGESSNRAVNLVSDDDPGYGGVDFGVEEGLTFADLNVLSTDYRFDSDDSCMGGSPRFQIGVQTDSGVKNIFAYIGEEPNYTECEAGVWTSSGDLLESGRDVDTSQLPGGTFYNDYDEAVEDYGDLTVVDIKLVADAGWSASDDEQAVAVDNTDVDGTVYTYEIPQPESREQCKNGGWRNTADADGNAFRNQGQCVSYYNQNR